MLHPTIRIITGIAGGILLAATIYFLPSFEREFFSENKDVLGAICFPLLTVSVALWVIVMAVSGKVKNWAAPIVGLGALLVATWYMRIFLV